jgi:uncharacterized iron-regulated membrane protein
MNQRIRKVIFWLHLAAGLVAGSVILVMSVTGTLLMYERQITEWADRGYRSDPVPGAARLSAEALLARAAAAAPDATPASLTLQSDPAAPAAVSLGRGRSVYLNPFTGRVLGEGAPRVRAFFRAVTDWHRWLGASDEKRDLGRAVTGACNLAFLVLVLSGLYLWLPRVWTRRQVRNVAWFRRGLSGKARDFNWHNVLGLWAWLPLVLVVASGVVLSYHWAGDLTFRLVGEEPPAEDGPPGAAAARAGGERRQGAGGPGGERRRERGAGAPAGGGAPSFEGLDELWAAAERQAPGWRTLTLRLPRPDAGPEAPVAFTVLRGHRGRPDLRAQLTLDRQSAAVVSWEPYAGQSLGRRLRSWPRWLHTGEAGGIAGQTLAGLASAAAAVLCWTGWALAWRRFVGWRRRESIGGPQAGRGLTESSRGPVSSDEEEAPAAAGARSTGA